MHIDPIEPKLKPPGSKRLELEYDGLLSNFGFKFNLRLYSLALDSCHRAVAAARQDALENSRVDANAILGNMRIELKDAWAAGAYTHSHFRST